MFVAAVASVSILWVILHLFSRATRGTLLPIGVLPRRHTRVTLKHLYLHIQTTAWNRSHDAISNALRQHDKSKVRWILTRFYDLGSMAGVLGMLGALCMLLWTFTGQAANLAHRATVGLSKRDSGATVHQYRPIIRPMIPGINIPLKHIPIVLVSVVVNQLVHEGGHFLSATLAQTPLQCLSLTLIFIFPTFSTVLSSPALAALTPFKRMRIITAGAWHNLVLWVLFSLVGRVFFNTATKGESLAGSERDVSMWGRVVLSVDEDSPLHSHLPPGTLITALDDTIISSTNVATFTDIWTSYLTLMNDTENVRGWCVQRDWFLGQGGVCCMPTSTSSDMDINPNLSCFTSLGTPPLERSCIDPFLILAQRDSRTRDRCADSVECEGATLCVHPVGGEWLLRLNVVMPGRWNEMGGAGNGTEEVVIWSGPRREVWEQVKVSTYSPPVRSPPDWMLELMHTCFEYLQMASLSLYFFNLLPLPALDGSQLLGVLLDMTALSGRSGMELLDLEEGVERRRTEPREGRNRWKNWARMTTEGVASVMCLTCIVLQTLDSVR